MKEPLIPAKETSRHLSLRQLDILDTQKDERFDRITRIAKTHFNVAIALVSLIDANRQWFKSCQGLDASETPRNISFCGHAILSEEIYVVTNAVEHPYFADNPLVTGPPNIRFYVRAPLHAPDGERIGTLCIIDPQLRHFNDIYRVTLRDFADLVEGELGLAHLRAITKENAEANYWAQIEAINRSQMMIEFNLDGTIIKANDNYLRALGYSAADISGQNHSIFVPDDDKNSPEYEAFWAGLKLGKFQSGEFKRVGKNGREVWIEASYNPILGPDGIPIKVVKFATDVTEKVNIRSEFQDAEARLRAILDNVIDGIITIDGKGTIGSINSAIEHMFGYHAEDVIGRNVKILMPEPNRDNHDGYLARYQSTGKTKAIGVGRELEGLTKDGLTFPMELTVTEVSLHGQRLFVGLVRDITKRRRAENETRQAMLAAEAANRAKSEFLAVMSHEIRTPLNGVLGTLGIMLENELSDGQRHFAEVVLRSGQSLLSIINDILDFSKMEAGSFDLSIESFDLRQLIDTVVEMVAHAASQKGLALETTIDPVLPRWLRGDSVRLRQILLNLTANAIKFSESGRVNIVIEPITPPSTCIRFAVTDTGIGISEADQARLFTQFTQVESSFTRKYGGTGLGLAICKKLVGLMGGEIGVTSQPGQGSTFWFTVLLEPGETQLPQPHASQLTSGTGHLLLAEDSEANRLVATTILRRSGYTVDTALNGAQAVEAVKQEPMTSY